MRRAVVRSVTASAAVPQFSVDYDLDAATLTAARDHWRAASVSDSGLVHTGAVRLGMLVEVGDGMTTPVLRDADRAWLTAAERRGAA
jgi:pyruvate/2-oxoglutarate dehydrogenase complex dihydrolipoamide acyltransferase (E2) component